MPGSVIVAGARTPIGKLSGALASFSAMELGGFAITAVHLEVRAKIPGADPQAFEKAANNAKTGCPVSKLFKAPITMDAKLEA